MTDLNETFEKYMSVCGAHKQEYNQLIVNVFETSIKDEVRNKGKPKTSIFDLRGNNYFHKDLNLNKLNDHDALMLFHTLKLNSFITGLDLRYNYIGDEGASLLAKLLTENSSIVYLNLMCNNIGPLGAEELSKALQDNASVTYFNLNGNKIGNQGGMFIAQMLQTNMTLRHLDLGDTDMKIESLIAVATVLNYNRSLQYLNVNRPVPSYELTNWMDDLTVHYAKMLKVNRKLSELHLQKYELRDYGAQWLSENLVYNRNLTHLDLSCNRITRDGAVFLSTLLKSNTPLKALDLGYNRLENDGAISLSEALMFANVTLEKLSIKSNNISGEGLCALCDALKYNSTLTHIFIWGNILDESTCIVSFLKILLSYNEYLSVFIHLRHLIIYLNWDDSKKKIPMLTLMKLIIEFIYLNSLMVLI